MRRAKPKTTKAVSRVLMDRERPVAKGIATRSKDATRGAPGLTTRSKKLLVARTTSNKKLHWFIVMIYL